ncbi:MAG: hypothetical protein UR85_C0002G0033 [Candidatus Nomurabacteria bacterium GW2011_GWF2_35_66]|uniref:Uncharacterized protein n=1 Tax=Candidatus Nomurabacteria bacterium GW2011_GWE1_35_16 TaxID=1618761 RepID=A0A0G0EGP4_9BACT|nr:MAG: hypothetical protein UR55_C0007G0009 [Candidatus Nomurabacteria bacterium GW2011_GWF1_34_20]KKP63284.1 MAG: hypothetical protein UR57_C0006G0009 [Candidatus Nomurabacteria bacterium GW2011_GWE2_34_25]KKP66482.1 MAG: hypothetical protein UR64_C0006G0009 [Candidatus Nomurabacteria bacterium GW2011_GWE1_35_16]KKP83720.1 MAG: hypothetical protein UR85_C0002G0033 [Candidatus Nomurabacteria bacterium GW2011_GWF2_35_66]HAE36410.1 hypothetical protein [Candidatus Nomurabacteria bacterium]
MTKNNIENILSSYTESDIEKIKTILEVIDIRLSINNKPYIIYIPFIDFPNSLNRFEIIDLLHKLDKELGVIKFTQITDGQKIAEQEVCIRITDDKEKFNTLIQIINKKYKNNKIIKKKEQPVSLPTLWLAKKDDGNYYYDGNRFYIKNKKTKYTIILDVIYSLKPEGGKVEYKKIIELCKKRGKNINKKSILRALTGKDATLFRYIKEIKQKLPYDMDLFVAMQDGKEIEFNNKK